jgi:hypothetical protein
MTGDEPVASSDWPGIDIRPPLPDAVWANSSSRAAISVGNRG